MSTEPLVGKIEKQRVPEGPYEAGPPSLSGTLRFPCCGENWVVSSEKITHVRCPDCGNLYTLALKFSLNPPVPSIYPKGSWITIARTFSTKVGAVQKQLSKGERYRVGHDAYGIFALEEGTIILEIPESTQLGPRTLLTVVPVSHVTLLEGTNAVKDTGRDAQDSGKDSQEEHIPPSN